MMEERQLHFRSNNDETLVVFTPDEEAAYDKAYKDIVFALHTLSSELKEKRLQVGFKETLGQCIENYALALCKALGHDGVIAREKEERYKEIRGLNEENRELRKQLGGKVTMEDVREALKLLDDKITRWWNIHGMGHISEKSFGTYGIEVTFSGMFTDAYYAKSKDQKEEEYETEEQKVDRFISEGYDIDKSEGRRDAKLLNTENNQSKLIGLINSRFPTAKLRDIKIVYWGKCAKGQIREIKIMITNLDEIVI